MRGSLAALRSGRGDAIFGGGWGHLTKRKFMCVCRVDVMFSIVYPDSDNELRPVQERRILYVDLADYERLRGT